MNERPNLPGIKEAELVKLGPCAICHKPLLGGAGVTFYRLTISHAAFISGALRRRVGLEMQIGAPASVMGPDEDLAAVFDGPKDVAVHERCADVNHLLLLFRETV